MQVDAIDKVLRYSNTAGWEQDRSWHQITYRAYTAANEEVGRKHHKCPKAKGSDRKIQYSSEESPLSTGLHHLALV